MLSPSTWTPRCCRKRLIACGVSTGNPVGAVFVKVVCTCVPGGIDEAFAIGSEIEPLIPTEVAGSATATGFGVCPTGGAVTAGSAVTCEAEKAAAVEIGTGVAVATAVPVGEGLGSGG